MRKSCLNSVFALAKQDPRVVFLGSDLGVGTMADFRKTFPDRFFMEGVAEQNLIGVAAGLAMDGFIPYVNTIASFITRRCLEQITIDLCQHNLPVRLIGNGGGLVYAPLGSTHLAADDVALMRVMPNMAIVAPADAVQMQNFVAKTLDWSGPIYIRLAKGGDRVVWSPERSFEIGKAVLMRAGSQVAFITTGIMLQRALTAAELLAHQGLDCAVFHFHTIKPLDIGTLLHAMENFPVMVTLEEHSKIGGLGSAVTECLCDHGRHPAPRLLRLGLPDQFVEHYGSQEELLASVGLHPEAIAQTVAHFVA